MKIQDVDKNFKIHTTVSEPDLVWINVREYPFALYGISYNLQEQCFQRMPQEIANTVSEGVATLNKHTAGGRVRFRTDSPFIAIHAAMDRSWPMPHMPRTGQSGFDLYRILDGKDTYFTTFVPPTDWEKEYSCGTKTYGELTDYTINFPLYDGVRELYIGVKKDSILEEPTPYKHSLPIVFYGNSITQGGCASRPGNSYEGFLARRLSVDYINLGFSGSGKGEKEMAEYVAGLDMQVLVMDYDSNAPTATHLQETHYPFYKTVRNAHPNLPIVMISHIAALHGVFYHTKVSDQWGTFAERKKIIKETYEKARAEGDLNVYFVDGEEVFRGEEWDAVTVDGTHPNDLGFLYMARYLEQVLRPLIG